MHKTRIRDVQEFLVQPVIVEEGEPLILVIDCFLKNPERRVIFVTNEKGNFLGSIRLSELVLRFWPYVVETVETVETSTPELVALVKASTAGHLASYSSFYVTLNSTLEEALNILVGNNLDSLPVLDEHKNIIGEVNFHNILSAYIKKKLDEANLF